MAASIVTRHHNETRTIDDVSKLYRSGNERLFSSAETLRYNSVALSRRLEMIASALRYTYICFFVALTLLAVFIQKILFILRALLSGRLLCMGAHLIYTPQEKPKKSKMFHRQIVARDQLLKSLPAVKRLIFVFLLGRDCNPYCQSEFLWTALREE